MESSVHARNCYKFLMSELALAGYIPADLPARCQRKFAARIRAGNREPTVVDFPRSLRKAMTGVLAESLATITSWRRKWARRQLVELLSHYVVGINNRLGNTELSTRIALFAAVRYTCEYADFQIQGDPSKRSTYMNRAVAGLSQSTTSVAVSRFNSALRGLYRLRHVLEIVLAR
jgi:hypothetical protein